MSERFTPSGWWLPIATAALGLLVGGVLMAGLMFGPASCCCEALELSDQRYQLSESTTALTLDAWQADTHNDAAGVEYANAGISQNAEELAAVNAEYETAKDQCND